MRPTVLIAAALFVSGSACAAEMYKWVDQNGVTNYTSDPPPKGLASKPIAEDRMSVYTPEPAVTQAIEAERNRKKNPPPPITVLAAPPPPPPGSAPVAQRPQGAYDPCLTGNDPNCTVSTIYDQSPVFAGRSGRAPVLNQPQIPAGTIAGQSTASGGITPGLSGLTPQAPLPARPVIQPRPRATPLGRGELSGQ